MLIQQDWLMRQIEMLISFIIRLFTTELSNESSSVQLEQELASLLQNGQLGKAEDLLFERLDPDDKSVLIVALNFYKQANALTDAQLKAQNFTREELLEGLKQAAGYYGLCLPGFLSNFSPSDL